MKKYCFFMAIFVSGCANYYQICDSPKKEGWLIIKPTEEIKKLVGNSISEETTGKLVWFYNKDGRTRLCEAHSKQNCASGYRTVKNGIDDQELMVSSCPNPY
jgi:hypothetical protein